MMTCDSTSGCSENDVCDQKKDKDSIHQANQIVLDLQLHINKLTDPLSDRFTKIRTLNHISTTVILPLLKNHQFATLSPILHVFVPILARCLLDSIEKCRELSAELLTGIFQVVTVDPFFPAIIPTLVDRLSGPTIIEPSEELRFVLVKLLTLFISRCESNPSFIVSDTCTILFSTLTDPFPDVRKESCHLVNLISTRCPDQVRLHADKLIKLLMPNLNYRHATVRIAALQAMGSLIMTDAGSLRNTWPTIYKLTMDSVVNVRKQLYTTVTSWALHLPDRYSFGDLFCLVLLSGQADDVQSLIDQCQVSIHQVSNLYENEWQDRIKDSVDYLPAIERRLMGFRMLVRDNLLKITDHIVEQLSDWTGSVRESAARILLQIIPMAREHISGYLGKLIPAMAKTISDPFRSLILDIAKCIGQYVSADLLLNLTLSHLHSPSYLALFSYAIQSTSLNLSHIIRILNDLRELFESDPTLVFNEESSTIATVFIHLLHQLEAINSSVNSTVDNTENNIIDYTSVLTLGLLLANDSDVKQFLIQSPLLLFTYVPNLLTNMSVHTPIVMHSLMFITLRQLLIHAPHNKELVSPLIPELIPVLDGIVADNDAVITIANDLVQYRFNPTIHHTISMEFVNIIWPWIMKRIEWKPGRPAMMLRSVVITMLENLLLSITPHIEQWDISSIPGVTRIDGTFAKPDPNAFTDIIVQIANCLDDNMDMNTRISGCRIISYLVQHILSKHWTNEHIKAIYPELLKRLDDAHDDVRIQACNALTSLYSNLSIMQSSPHIDDNQQLISLSSSYLDSTHHFAIVQGIAIHVDDSNPSVSLSALYCLRAIAQHHYPVVHDYISTSTKLYRNQHLFDEFLTPSSSSS